MTKLHRGVLQNNTDVLTPKTFSSEPSQREDGSSLQSGDLAYSDGTSSTNNFGVDGPGIYENISGSWRKVSGNAPFIDGGVIAADVINNEITVKKGRRYTLTADDTIAGVIGLADGEFAQLIAPVSGSTTLQDEGAATSGQSLKLSGADLVIQSTDEAVYTITRAGANIRVSGGAAKSGIETVASLSALKALNISSRLDGDLAYVNDDKIGGLFVWKTTDFSGIVDQGSDGAITKATDSFTAASASFSASNLDTRSGGNDDILEVSGAGFNGTELIAKLFSTSGSTQATLRIIDASETVSGANWTLWKKTSPKFWEQDGQEGCYIPPTSDTSGASGMWVRVDWLESGEVRPEWFGAVANGLTDGSGTDDGPAFQRAIEFIRRHDFDLFEEERSSLKCTPGANYKIATSLTIHPDMERFTFYSPSLCSLLGGGNDFVLLTTGGYKAPGTDTNTALTQQEVFFKGLKFECTNTTTPLTNPAIALRAANANIGIRDCVFEGWTIGVDGHRLKMQFMDSCKFNVGGRVSGLNAIEACVKMQGVFNSTNAYQPGGGNHFSNIEVLGNTADNGATQAVFKMLTVDGNYFTNVHMSGVGTCFWYEFVTGQTYNQVHVTNLFTQVYMDDKDATTGRGVFLTGTLDDDQSTAQEWIFNNCYFRTGINAFRSAVADSASGWENDGTSGNISKTFGMFTFNGCLFRQSEGTALQFLGEENGYLSPKGVVVSNCTFDENNRGDLAAVSDILSEAKNIIIDGNMFLRSFYEVDQVIYLTTNQAATGATRAATITSNDFRFATYTDSQPWKLANAAQNIDLNISSNLLANQGQRIQQSFGASTVDDGSAIVWRQFMSQESNAGHLQARVLGVSKAGAPTRFYSYKFDAGIRRTDTETLIDYGALATNDGDTITNNDLGAALVKMDAAAHASGTYALGDVVSNAGHIYVLVVVGTGTSSTAPTHTDNASALYNTDWRWMHIGPVESNTIALAVTDGGTSDTRWTVDIDWISNYDNVSP